MTHTPRIAAVAVAVVTTPAVAQPAEPDPQPTSLGLPTPASAGRPFAVLIVDGDPDARISHALAFERRGCLVTLAADVPEAVILLSQPWRAIDRVLIGLADDMAAETLLVILRNTERLAGIRTVAHGGVRDDARAAGLLGYGAAGVLAERASVGELWDAIFEAA
jgi:ActR/RegA family two-component response regulator